MLGSGSGSGCGNLKKEPSLLPSSYVTGVTDTDVHSECLPLEILEMADDNIQRLTRIEAGQGFLCESMKELQWTLKELQLATLKVAAQEERQVQLRIEVDALWKKVDRLNECQSKCPIQNLKTQVGWIWVFLSGLALGLTMLFVTRVVPS